METKNCYKEVTLSYNNGLETIFSILPKSQSLLIKTSLDVGTNGRKDKKRLLKKADSYKKVGKNRYRITKSCPVSLNMLTQALGMMVKDKESEEIWFDLERQNILNDELSLG